MSVAAVLDVLRGVPSVTAVALTGSGARGDRTPLSDWDFELQIEDAAAFGRLEQSLQELPVLALFWDPLSTRASLIVLMDGPIKIDVIVADVSNPRPMSRWTVTPESLPDLDAHFWDWTLWLASKKLRGQDALVDSELAKMWDALLQPLGARNPPHAIDSAVSVYVHARDARASELATFVDRRLEHQVRAALVAHGVIAGI
jgi:predicted nucleotidyltransferase